jgi:serine/threonine-protein kinase
MVIADRYEVVELLGEGGMGRVYRVVDRILDEQVALKVLHGDLMEDDEALIRFRREAKLARRVTHPNVARVFDVSEHGDRRFLTMEVVEGRCLGEILQSEGRLSPSRVIEIALQICDGLLAAHRAGVIHRDLKPQNIIVQDDGRVVITDFGIARAIGGARITKTEGTVGTPAYMAPEQVRCEREIDARADIYALGAVLFELLTGEPPWDGESVYVVAAARLSDRPPDPRDRIELPDELAEIILRCLARDPDDRFADVGALADALRSFLRSVAPGEGATHRAVPMTWRRAVAVLASGDRDLAAGIRSLVVDGLRAARGLDFCPTRRADVTGEALRAAGATSLLVVDAQREDRVVTLRAELREVPSGRVSWSTDHQTTIDSVVNGALSVVDRLAEFFGVSAPARLPRSAMPEGEVESLMSAFRLHESWLGEEDNDRAIATFEAAFRAQPDDPWVNAGYASALLRRFVEADGFGYDLDEALAMAERALSEAPRLASARATLAEVHFELGRPLAACREALEVLAEQPRSAKPLAVIGRGWLLVGEPRRAVRCFERASDLGEPRRVRNDLAVALALEGRGDEARRLLEAASERERGVWHHWFHRARVAVWVGDDAMQAETLAGVAKTLFTHRDDLLSVVGAMTGAGAPEDALRRLRLLSQSAGQGLRRRAQLLATQIELLVTIDGPRILEKIEPNAITKLLELAWLEHSPAMHVSRRSFGHRSLSSQLTQAHALLRQLLSSSRF